VSASSAAPASRCLAEQLLADTKRIVIGHKGHFLRDHLLGSTADRVAEHADCPVMIVK
jgi:nucleotide-binding universal stress UspA family protein